MSQSHLRVNKIRDDLCNLGCDFYITENKENIFYLLGKNIEGLFLIAKDGERPFFLSDSRFSGELKSLKTQDCKIYIVKKSFSEEVVKIIKKKSFKAVVAVDPQMAFGFFRKLKKSLPSVRFKEKDILKELRMIKDAKEINLISIALAITRKALKNLKNSFLSKTEREIKNLLEIEFLKLGAEEEAFGSIVAASYNSAYPHAVPQSKKIKKKDGFLLIDCGAKYNGYCADLTEMFFWDRIPKVIKEAYRVVEEAGDLAFSLICEGEKIENFAKKIEVFIKKKGFAKNIYHGFGHGIGIAVHEKPVLNRYSKDVFKSGMVLALEPGLYFPGIGGVRKENVILVTKSGAKRL